MTLAWSGSRAMWLTVLVTSLIWLALIVGFVAGIAVSSRGGDDERPRGDMTVVAERVIGHAYRPLGLHMDKYVMTEEWEELVNWRSPSTGMYL